MYGTVASTVALLSIIPSTCAWGNLGHQTVGYIAQAFVSDDTAQWVHSVLGDTESDYMAYAATWADTYRYTDAGSFSAPFHFIDAQDNPPSSCSVNYDRDCGESGCSVSAIVNYTSIVQDNSVSASEQQMAMKFLIHFLGDITQPLHDENEAYGGNDIDVTWDGKSNNLHHIWDTEMLEKYTGGTTESTANTWANQIISEIKTGQYKSEAASWISGMSLSNVEGTAMKWATDANTFVCSYVLKGGESAVEKGDLDGDYYTNAVPIFNQQIAKGGYRLAAWLNLINDGTTGL